MVLACALIMGGLFGLIFGVMDVEAAAGLCTANQVTSCAQVIGSWGSVRSRLLWFHHTRTCQEC